MKKILVAFILVIILLSIDAIAQSEIGGFQIPAKVSIHAEYLGDNKSTWGFNDVLINININRLGHLLYIEEYYTIDANENPKYITSNKYYDNNITYTNISFQILRPFSSSGKYYSLVRGVVILDNKRVNERWLTTTENGTHLTYTEEDIATKINENIDKFEIEDKFLIANISTTYKFTTPDLAIYEVDITSAENENSASLRIESLKGIPIFAEQFPGAVYKYLDIALDTNKIKKISLRFKVENFWINNSDVSGENVKLFKWNTSDNKWYGLKTNLINKDTNYIYYESEAVDMSQFAIAGLRNFVMPVNQTTDLIDNLNVSSRTNTMAPIPPSAMTKETEQKITKVSIIEMIKKILGILARV